MVDVDSSVRRRGRTRRSAGAANLVLAVAVLVFTTLRDDETGYLRPDPMDLLQWTIAIACAAAVAGRVRWPSAALVVAAASEIVASMFDLAALGTHLTWAIVVYTVARTHTPLATAVRVGPLLVATLIAFVVHEDGRWLGSTTIAATAATAVAVAIGTSVRSAQEVQRVASERAALAETTRESEAARRVAEDRLRTARDLHDVIAHRIAVINLHAGLVARSLPDDAVDADRGLRVIRDASRAILDDIQDMLEGLRGGTAGGPRHRIEQVPELVGEFRALEMPIDCRVTGAGALVDPTVSEIAFRVVQEGLTNALKHGDPTAVTVVDVHIGEPLEIRIANPVATGRPADARGGHGLRGLEELVTAIGGSLARRATDADFELRVTLPADVRTAA